jgi:hypothetical protein
VVGEHLHQVRMLDPPPVALLPHLDQGPVFLSLGRVRGWFSGLGPTGEADLANFQSTKNKELTGLDLEPLRGAILFLSAIFYCRSLAGSWKGENYSQSRVTATRFNC